MQNIIVFCGHIGSGKDTAAKYFIDNYGYKTSKMAGASDRVGSLKRVVFEIFDLDLSKVEDRDYREAPHKNLNGKTPRKALQYFGNETRQFFKDVWVNNTIKHIKTLGNKNFVISDARYSNEIEAIKLMECEDTRVHIVAIKKSSLNLKDEMYKDPSEEQIPQIQSVADFTIFNDSDIQDFHEHLRELYQTISNVSILG